MSITGYHWTDETPLQGRTPDGGRIELPRSYLYDNKTGTYKAYVAGKEDGTFEVLVGRPTVPIGNTCESLDEAKKFAEETLIHWKLV
jgi:hypothetical protein